jgi:hypothetical protein
VEPSPPAGDIESVVVASTGPLASLVEPSEASPSADEPSDPLSGTVASLGAVPSAVSPESTAASGKFGPASDP